MSKSYKTSRHTKKRPTRTSRKSRHTKKRRTSRHTKKRRQRRGGWPWGAKPAPKALVATPPVVRAPVCSRKSYLFDTEKYRTYGNYEGDRKMVKDKCVAHGQGKWVSTNGKMTLDGTWKNDKYQKPSRGPSSTPFEKAMTKTGYTEEGKTRLREFGSR